MRNKIERPISLEILAKLGVLFSHFNRNDRKITEYHLVFLIFPDLLDEIHSRSRGKRNSPFWWKVYKCSIKWNRKSWKALLRKLCCSIWWKILPGFLEANDRKRSIKLSSLLHRASLKPMHQQSIVRRKRLIYGRVKHFYISLPVISKIEWEVTTNYSVGITRQTIKADIYLTIEGYSEGWSERT